MSTKFYIKDENGIFLSIDGKTKYTCLEGQALYDFLKTEDGRGRCFHVDIDEDGNKIGIEASPEFLKAEESDKNHAAYLERQKAESGVEIISANIIVRDSERYILRRVGRYTAYFDWPRLRCRTNDTSAESSSPEGGICCFRLKTMSVTTYMMLVLSL